MKHVINLALAVTLALVIFGCSKPASTEKEVAQVAATATPSAEKVAVSAEGTKFDPAVPVAQIPDEAWACVMGGTVHYAAMDKGTGKCAICKMNLVQHAAHQ
jgi:hypothetical protein